MKNIKWWQKKVKGWVVPFWYTDTPIYSKRFSQLSNDQVDNIANQIRKNKN
tara:strand:- start:309 stop:461 length:153 start_codon:yes stop_codon:yes gene_type:complete